ncbi:MAG: thiol peroxidase [Phycisphaera sp.]|nr:thiol peroxidase [Phycisphaera sp.]
MTERAGAVLLKGNPKTLVGDEVKEGQKAPAFTVKGQDLSDITLDSFAGKVLVLSTVPSLDTPVCEIETKKFNESAADLGDDVQILVVSLDMPFAQKRWCGANGVSNVKTGSDYMDHSFGKAYGVRIKEVGFLARAVFVIDKTGTVTHAQLVPEVAQEPDYAAVLAAAKAAV